MRLADYYSAMARSGKRYYQRSEGAARILQGLVEWRIRGRLQRALADAKSIADIGCGFGHYLTGLDRASRLLLNDLSAEMVEAARSQLEDRYPDLAIRTHIGDLREQWAEASETYELVLSVGVINHVPAPQLPEVLAGLARLSGSRIVVVYAHAGFVLASRVGASLRAEGLHYQPHGRKAVRAIFEELNFRRVHSSHTFGVPFARGGRKSSRSRVRDLG